MIETPKPTVSYLKCQKEGMHSEEDVNLVCLEKTCLDNPVGCCACIEEEHKKHKTKPLKMVISQVQSQCSSIQSKTINIDIMLDILKAHREQTFELFQKHKREVKDSLQMTERTLINYFDHTTDQILLKNSDANMRVEEALQSASLPLDHNILRLTLKKIVNMLSEQNDGHHLSEQELKQSLHSSTQSIQQSIVSSMQEIKGKLQKVQKGLTGYIVNNNIWQINYKFSNKLKHVDIKVISDSRVKAINAQGYKFAVMEPQLDKVNKKTFSFQIKESKTNWIAVGFCHRKIVESKNYSFVFGSIGHGAYMISSNGGSWSNHNPQENNTLKAIKFTKGDTVHASIDPIQSKISFNKNTSTQHYNLGYKIPENEELSPCVLFYYKDDEIEYLGNLIK